MSVYKRGGVYWMDFWLRGRRHRESTKLSNKGAALQFEAEKRSQVASGKVLKESPLFDVFVDEFLVWSRATKKHSTHERYEVSCRRLKKSFRGCLDEIDTAMIERFKVERLKECTPAAVNRDLSNLRFMLGFAIRQGYLAESPFRGVKLLKEDSGCMRIVSPDEERLYFSQAHPALRDVAQLMLNSGMRPNEVFRLHRDNVNLEEQFVFIPEGKTKFARRTIPLAEQAGVVLGRRVSQAKNGWLFPNRLGTGPTKIVTGHQALAKKLKLDFRLYDFRHTFGSRAAMAGVDLPTLKELMGHSHISLTMRYVHPTPEHKRQAMRKFEAWHNSPHTDKNVERN